jgi:AcrR family transcriptional regulator
MQDRIRTMPDSLTQFHLHSIMTLTSLYPFSPRILVVTTIITFPTSRFEKAQRRREEILDVAARVFSELGYSETDTDELAARLKVGKGTLYRYFPSKRELFLAAADRVMRRLRQYIDSSLEGVTDPFERITCAVRAFLCFCSEHREFVELLIQERAQFKDRTKPTYFEHREAHVKRWQDLYRDLIAQERIRDIPVERITDIIGNQLYGTLFTNYFAGSSKTWQQQADDILDVVFNGIISRAERDRWEHS